MSTSNNSYVMSAFTDLQFYNILKLFLFTCREEVKHLAKGVWYQFHPREMNKQNLWWVLEKEEITGIFVSHIPINPFKVTTGLLFCIANSYNLAKFELVYDWMINKQLLLLHHVHISPYYINFICLAKKKKQNFCYCEWVSSSGNKVHNFLLQIKMMVKPWQENFLWHYLCNRWQCLQLQKQQKREN